MYERSSPACAIPGRSAEKRRQLTSEAPPLAMTSGPSRRLVRGRIEDPANGADDLFPPCRLRRELFAARRRQPVVLRLAVVVGRAPERCDPAAVFQPVQGWIEGAVLDLEHVLRAALD